MNKYDYALIGIAVAGLLMIGIPIAVSAEMRYHLHLLKLQTLQSTTVLTISSHSLTVHRLQSLTVHKQRNQLRNRFLRNQ